MAKNQGNSPPTESEVPATVPVPEIPAEPEATPPATSKEYEVVIITAIATVTFSTDKRKLARACKEIAAENGAECEVTRTAKKAVKFAKL